MSAESFEDSPARAWASPDLRAVVRPSRVDRLADARDGWRGLLRRPLFFLFACGCVVSLEASGRLTLRLVVDGMVSFAFAPVFQIASLAVVAPRRPAGVGFTRLVDAFFTSDAAVLLWLVAVGAIRASQTPFAASTSSQATVMFGYVASFVMVAAWSAYVDFWFFRRVLGHPSGRAARDLVIQRAIAWGASLVYFFGLAAWPMFLGMAR